MTRPPPRSTLFPYTPLSQSRIRPPISSNAPEDLCAESSSDLPDRKTFNPFAACGRLKDMLTSECSRKQPKNFASLIPPDRKSTRLNSSHLVISYAVFCLKKK